MAIRPDQDGFQILHQNGVLVRADGTVLQATGTGNTHTKAAGSTTAVYTNTTFDGSIGTTGYTVGDIVAALKGAGILA